MRHDADIHRQAWRLRHGASSVPRRDFLVCTRPVGERAGFLPGDLCLVDCQLAAITRKENREFPVPMARFEPWLSALLARNGMTLLRVMRADPVPVPMGRSRDGKQRPTLHTVRARFAVRIDDAAQAEHAYAFGLGRHKAWGCGAMTIVDRATFSV